MIKRAMVVAPHCDDEVLGVGGYIAKLSESGTEVYVLIMCDRSEGHAYQPRLIDYLHKCARKACCDVLGAKDVFFAHLREERLDTCLSDVIVPMEKHIALLRPDLLFLPWRGDANQDHRAVYEAGLVSSRTLGNWEDKFSDEELPPEPAGWTQANKQPGRYNVRKVLHYEVPSTTEQGPPLAEWCFNPNVFVDITGTIDKKVEALKCYDTEIAEFPFPRSEGGLRALAATRGMACAVAAAEAFVLKREIVF